MVSVGRPVLAATVHGCTNVGVIFGWIVATKPGVERWSGSS